MAASHLVGRSTLRQLTFTRGWHICHGVVVGARQRYIEERMGKNKKGEEEKKELTDEQLLYKVPEDLKVRGGDVWMLCGEDFAGARTSLPCLGVHAPLAHSTHSSMCFGNCLCPRFPVCCVHVLCCVLSPTAHLQPRAGSGRRSRRGSNASRHRYCGGGVANGVQDQVHRGRRAPCLVCLVCLACLAC